MFGLKRRLASRLPTLIKLHKVYHAAVYKNIEQIPGRIKQDCDGNTLLQALTDQQIGPNLRVPDNKFKQFMFGHTYRAWQTLLIIESDKKTIVWEKNNRTYPILTATQPPPDEVIFPKKLYAISQSIWDSFIHTLANQEVVRLLHLNQHRHLWLGYNYAVHEHSDKPSLDQMYKRATLIGTHHFLLSIAMAPWSLKGQSIHFVNGYYSKDRREWYRVQYRNAFRFMPMYDIKNDLRNGLFYREKMLQIHPNLNATLLKKMAHCTSFLDVCLLAGMISSYSKLAPMNQQKLLEDKRTFDAVNWVNSSTNSPKAFADTLVLARKASVFTRTISGWLFFNSRKKWSTNEECYAKDWEYIHGGLGDYIDMLFNDLILRELLLQFKRHYSVNISRDLAANFRSWFVKTVVNTYSIDQIDRLQERWHRNLQVIEAIKPSKKATSSWTPIIENTSLDDIQITVLTSEGALKAHGLEMGHCVGGYAKRCRTEYIDIIELMDSNNSKSTLEICHVMPNNIRILQHRSYRNAAPSDKHLRIASTLIYLMNGGQLIVNEARLNEVFPEDYADGLNYELDDLVTQELIYRAYKDRQLLPTTLLAVNYQQMLEKTHLKDMIKDFIETRNAAQNPMILLAC